MATTNTKKIGLSEEPFEPQPNPGGTAAVLTTPSAIDREIALKAADQVPLDVVCRDLGAIAAREFANVLDTYALKPADYADQPKVAEKLARNLSDVVSSSDAFKRAFRETLRARG